MCVARRRGRYCVCVEGRRERYGGCVCVKGRRERYVKECDPIESFDRSKI